MADYDYYIYEGDDIDIRATIADPNDDLPASIADATLVWVATGSVGGIPIITKGTANGSITIEDPVNYIIRVHIDGTDTRNKPGILYYETKIVVSGNKRVLRLVGQDKGIFEIRQSDTDEVVV